jgi:hypothetical protein
MRRPSGACRSTESRDLGWFVISKDPVGTTSKSGFDGVGGVGGMLGVPSA